MRKINTIAALIGGMGLAFATASAAQASVFPAAVDTFNFTVTGWEGADSIAAPTGVLTGSFTGTVEPDGYILLSDLTAFSATFSVNGNVSSIGLPLLGVFSIDTNPEYTLSSTLLFAGSEDLPSPVCVGSVVTFDPACSVYGNPPSGTTAVALSEEGPALSVYYSSTAPTVTLVSSVAPTPLPATLPLFASGLGALGLLGWRRKRKAQVVVA
jgi:hypothetical protein